MSATSERPAATSEQRELLRGLARGARPEDLAWALGATPEELAEQAEQALAALAEPPTELPARERAAVGNYLLGRQSPGQAAGTWALLEESEPAREWGTRLRAALADITPDPPPPVPSEGGDAPSPAQRARRIAQAEATPLARRRRKRDRTRTAANVQAAVAEVASPFRKEALDAQRDADERIKLPRFASKPARLTLYVLIAALLAGLVMSVFVRIPVHTAAIVLVAKIPPESPAPEAGMHAIALFDSTSGARLKDGQILRVQLPDTKDRVSMRVTRVLKGIRSPREIITDFGLGVGQANRLTSPAIVVVARMAAPEGRREESFEGAVTTDADARTGSRRIISLLDVF